MSGAPSANAAYRSLGALARQLRASGVRHAVIAPGSRSTPLVLALERTEGIRSWLHLDERAAAYFALGLARQLREPVAIVTTSGTAAANLHPAIAEASLSRVPLIALTADRPPELRDTGANQTIEQHGLYGRHVRWFAELPVADGSPGLETHARSSAARAAAVASGPPAGPVQLNIPLREPLIEPGWEAALEASSAPPVAVTAPPARDASEAAVTLLEQADGRRGLIFCGPANGDLPARAIAELAAALGWPILADPLSGLRAGTHPLAQVVETYDALLRSPRFAAGLADTPPEVVLRFGAAPTTRPLLEYLARLEGVPQLAVDAPGGWRDPDASITAMLWADPAALCETVSAALAARSPGVFRGSADDPARTGARTPPDRSWLERWTDANAAARRALGEAIAGLEEPFEGLPPALLASALPDGATLVAGNSMPVRDLDSFFPATPRRTRLVGTRGASGIDGVVSTAVGAAAAGEGPVAVLVGDLSFLHDLNGLWALRRHGLALLVLLVNNDGGGIFHFLPQREQAAGQFEDWWGTPHGIDFEGAIRSFGGRLLRPALGEWREAIAGALATPGLTVLELRTERERNVELHREVWARVDAALREPDLDAAPAASAPAR
ncbi:MAG: 2-succinyl-5-enolpyruvyl-6-hydroxy-3-cyclohexene-1-carboxylic-acid synthase [Chloroflexi bacterium]|nr:2-succinyl-5-enolpyruvyl-6-hydroxy-3-cyclohexene-1-carboxylic-acid synthase [Chloroflexota bacterium]